MSVDLTQDPLYVDATTTDIPCKRIVGVVATGQCSITDSTTNHILFENGLSTDGWYGINVVIAGGLIDVAIVSGAVMIYLGSGKQ